jgi:serralysin
MALIPNSQDLNSLISGNNRGTADLLTAISSQPLLGDAGIMTGNSLGGNDTITASAVPGLFTAFGDAYQMSGSARGGSDTMTGGDSALLSTGDTGQTIFLLATNLYSGDGQTLSGSSRGGNDVMIGGYLAINRLSGDAVAMEDQSRGGNDRIEGGLGGFNFLIGDSGRTGGAEGMTGYARGGNDILIAGDFSPDAPADSDFPQANQNVLIGDSKFMSDHTVAGKDRLVSGTAVDQMFGDAIEILGNNVTTAADIFVFKPGSNHDVIGDFRQSDGDRIDVSAYGFDSLSDLTISGNLVSFGGGNDVTLSNFAGTLTAADFIFA